MSDNAAKPKTAAMRFIMIAVLIDMISIGLIVPVLPALVGKFTGSQADQAYWLGWVTFTFAIANFFAAPILGALSDRYGRRPVLLLGFCGLALNFFATALATSMWMLIASRLVGGGMQANAAVANAYVADISAPEERAKRFGMLGAMFGLGFIAGPALGGLLGTIDLRLPFAVAGCLGLLNLLYGYFVLPESLPPEQRHEISWGSVNPISSLRRLAGMKGIGALVGVIACTGLAQGMHHTDPHTPYSPPEPYNTMFGNDDGRGRHATQRQIDLYNGEIRFTDDQMGRVIDWIDRNGLRTDTDRFHRRSRGESWGT